MRAPFWIPDFSIKKFVEERSSWIIAHINRLNSKKTSVRTYKEGELHLFFGREYPLAFLHHSLPIRTKAAIAENKLLVTIYEGHDEAKKQLETQDAIVRLYLEEGIGIITEKVNFYSAKLNVSYSRIELKKVSSIWGSCSASNNLSFNRKLVMAPHEIVDYVVIHETCHMIQRNHSSRFWALVARLDPNYRQHRRWLRDNHHLLTI